MPKKATYDANLLVSMNLQRLRLAQDVSQEVLARTAGVDRTYVSAIERGLRNPTVAVLQQLGDAMGVHIREFFEKIEF